MGRVIFSIGLATQVAFFELAIVMLPVFIFAYYIGLVKMRNGASNVAK